MSCYNRLTGWVHMTVCLLEWVFLPMNIFPRLVLEPSVMAHRPV